MSTLAKQGWISGEDGAPDWERIFEDETNGFIPEFQHASTPFIIKEIATVIVQQLFLREDDSINLMKYVIALNQIIPDDRETETDKWVIMEMRDGVIKLLRKIKIERIQRAKAKNQNKNHSQPERRVP